MQGKDRIIFACDFPDWEDAEGTVLELADHVGLFKAGLEIFIADRVPMYGPASKSRLMLDLKLLDIPETVERAVRTAAKFRPKFLTIRIGQRAVLERAAKAANEEGIQLLGVTVLTSMTGEDLAMLGFVHGFGPPEDVVKHHVMRRVQLGVDCGLTGFVCSPHEVKMLREQFEPLTFVVPGVRPVGAAAGDQKRVATPERAVHDGADYVVIGRPIRDAKDPVQAAKDIAHAIDTFVPDPG